MRRAMALVFVLGKKLLLVHQSEVMGRTALVWTLLDVNLRLDLNLQLIMRRGLRLLTMPMRRKIDLGLLGGRVGWAERRTGLLGGRSPVFCSPGALRRLL